MAWRLVFGLVEFEGVFEFANEFVAGGEGVAYGHFAFGVKFEKFVGHVFHGLAHAGFGLGPGLRAEMTQGWLGAFGGAIFLNQVETRQRNVEARAFGIFEQHELGVAVALIDFFQALILADAVFDVDNVVADLQIAEVGEERGDFRFLRAAGGRLRRRIRRTDRASRRWRDWLGEKNAVGDVGLSERGGEDFSGEVTGLVGVTFAAAGAASQTKRDVVLGEDVGEALDFAGVGDGKEHLLAVGGELLDFLKHGRELRRGSAGVGWVRKVTADLASSGCG